MGAKRAGHVAVEMSPISHPRGAWRRTRKRPTGAIRAAAAPCPIRAATKPGCVGAIAQNCEAKLKRLA